MNLEELAQKIPQLPDAIRLVVGRDELLDILKGLPSDQAARALWLIENQYLDKDRKNFLKAAQEQEDDDFEVDDDAPISRADTGCWVMSWVFVYDETAGVSREVQDEPDALST